MPREEVVHYYAETENWETPYLEGNEVEDSHIEHNLDGSNMEYTEDEDGQAEHNLDALKTSIEEDGQAEHNLDALNRSVALQREDEIFLFSQGSLRSFLKLPVQRVTKRLNLSDNTSLRL